MVNATSGEAAALRADAAGKRKFPDAAAPHVVARGAPAQSAAGGHPAGEVHAGLTHAVVSGAAAGLATGAADGARQAAVVEFLNWACKLLCCCFSAPDNT